MGEGRVIMGEGQSKLFDKGMPTVEDFLPSNWNLAGLGNEAEYHGQFSVENPGNSHKNSHTEATIKLTNVALELFSLQAHAATHGNNPNGPPPGKKLLCRLLYFEIECWAVRADEFWLFPTLNCHPTVKKLTSTYRQSDGKNRKGLRFTTDNPTDLQNTMEEIFGRIWSECNKEGDSGPMEEFITGM